MKKLVFLVAICLLPNLVMAENEWPTFSNKAEDPLSFESLMIIAANTENTHPIENFSYKITEFNCTDAVNAASKDKSVEAEFRPDVVGFDGEGINTYHLYVGDELVDGTETRIERKVTFEEEKEIPLGNSDSAHQIIENGDEMPLKTGKAKNPAKNGLMGSCNLL
ncbi:MAG: hypothetical protein Q8K37_02650 [Alphaproteobacteria bacterium]|nr:hypothetical protein [Alphaproteobacteria bacterium]